MAREIAINFALNGVLGGGFKSAFQGAARQVENITKAIQNMERSPVGKLGASMEAQRQKIKAVAAQIEATKKTLASLQAQKIGGNASPMLQRQIDAAQKSLASLTSQMARQRNSWLELSTQASTFCGSVRNLNTEYGKLTENIERARAAQTRLVAQEAKSSALQAQRQELQSRLAGTAAAAATFAMPVKLAINAEDTFADLKKVMDAPDDMIQQVYADAIKMSNATGKSFEDVITIMTAGAQGGLGKTREELLGMADQALKMAVAWGVSADEAGNSLKTWRASMGLSENESKHLADVINALSNEMNAEAKDINDIVTRMGALMKGSGLAAQDIAALATAFKAAGAQVEVSGTAMKNFTRVMSAGSSGLTDKQNIIYKYLQINPDELQKQMITDSRGAIMRVLQALRNVRPEEQTSLAMQLFGSESIAAITPLLAQFDQLQKAYSIANGNVDNSVEEEYANRMKTTATAISQATQSFRNLGITIGNTLLPVVTPLIQWTSGFIQSISNLVKRFPGLSAAVMGGVAGFFALTTVSIMARLTINYFRSGLLSLTGAYTRMTVSSNAAAAGQTRFAFASKAAGSAVKFFSGGLRSLMIASGVGAVLVGLGFAINLLIDNWDSVVSAMSGAWQWVTNTWGKCAQFFTVLGQNLMAIFPMVWQDIQFAAQTAVYGIKQNWQDFTGWISGIFSNVIQIAQNMWQSFVNGWNFVTGIARAAWQGVVNMVSVAGQNVAMIWQGVVTFFGGVFNSILQAGSTLWGNISGFASDCVATIQAVWDNVTGYFQSIVNGIVGIFQSCFDWLAEKFAWVLSTIDTIKGAVSKITGAVGDAWDYVMGNDDKKPADTAKEAENSAPAATAAKNEPVAQNAANANNNQHAPKKEKGPAANIEMNKPQLAAASTPNVEAAKQNPATQNSQGKSFKEFLDEEEARKQREKEAKKAAKKKGKGAGGGKSRGCGGAKSGASKDEGPVHTFTIGDNGQIQSFHSPANGARTSMSGRSAMTSTMSGPRTSMTASGSKGGLFGSLANNIFGGVSNVVSSAAAVAKSGMNAMTGDKVLPQSPAIAKREIARMRGEGDQGANSINVDVKQNFALMGDADKIRQVMEQLKPDFEALVRKALANLQSNKSRTAYVQ